MANSIIEQLPDLSLDFKDERIEIGDTLAYINKHRQWQAELEDWSKKLVLYAGALESLVNEARDVPNDVRLQLAQFVLDAQIAARQCAAAAAGLNLPLVGPSDKGKVLRVNDAATGYTLDEYPQYEFVTEI